VLLTGFAAAALFGCWRAEAQLVNGNQWPHPRLNVLAPTGGKAGTTFEVTFNGTDTELPESLWFSHAGIKGTPIIPPPPPVDPKAKPDPKAKKPEPPPVTKFNVSIDKAVPPGFYEVRFINKVGISNPRVFVVGELKEVMEKEPNNDVEQAQRVEIGSTINGVINPATDVDYTVFAGKKGQRVLISCLAASIDSKLNPELTVFGPVPRVPLGVAVEPFKEKDKVKGLKVTQVAPGSPAQQAGVQAGDVVYKLNGKDVADDKQFLQDVGALLSGEKLNLQVLRNGKDAGLTAVVNESLGHGRQIAAARPPLGQDGVVDLTLPADGDYLVRLSQFTYTNGGPDYYYRLSIAAGPWIESLFPPMIEPGKAAQVTVHGFNLPGGKIDPTATINDRPLEKLTVNVTAPADPAGLDKLRFSGMVPPLTATLDGFEYRLGASNPRLITYARYPVIIENDDNDTPEKAQAIPVPCEVAGRVDKKRDRDWYAFTAKKGDVLMIELQSERLGAPTDMYFKLVNMTGKAPQDIVFQDDAPESMSFYLFTATSDPAPYRFAVQADGKYCVMVGSHLADNQADPRHVYRLRIGPEKPDFRIIAMPPDEHRPEALTVGQGGHEYYLVHAQRFDGFKGDITLAVEGLPPGVTAAPQVLNGNMKSTHLVLTAADGAAPFIGTVKVIGTAVINGQKVVHEARPMTITWGIPPQQNIRTVTRLDQALILAVREKAPGKLQSTPDKFVVSVGDKLNIPMKLTRASAEFKGNFQVTPSQPPDLPPGVAFAPLTFAPGKDDVPVALTVGPNTPPGKYNFVFRGFAPISPKEKGKPVNTILPSNPIEVIVLPKQVANLSVANPNLTVEVGGEVALDVRVQRLFDYADAFKVELVLPPNVKGVTMPNITIGPGANEAKLTLKIPQGTPPTNLQNLTLKAVAVVNGNVNLTHETKINVNVVLPKQVANLSVANPNLTVEVGGEVALDVRVQRLLNYADAFKLELVLPPNVKGVTLQNITIGPGANEGKLTLKVPQGTPPTNLQNLTLKAVAVVNGNVNLTHETKVNVNVVLPKQVANLTVANPNVTVKVGGEATLDVRVQRLLAYADAFKVELVLPPNVKGVTAQNITIGPGANEAKLTMKVSPDTPPANLQNLTLKAVAVVNGNVNLTHETKVNVNIVK
jgi:hypothetical protein